ncbi:MAG: L,D-transpeptidase family protein [Planctomycetaceae bacterium]|nr:L,D-transpeptidase family protein [Planctomycetaceae bacterium]MCA9097852.1 L,D-transpeptidase family protein [Planctomycetaceae bacterium]
MFDQTPKRHPVQTFYFWFLILVSFVGLLGWKFDLIPGSSRDSVTEFASTDPLGLEKEEWIQPPKETPNEPPEPQLALSESAELVPVEEVQTALLAESPSPLLNPPPAQTEKPFASSRPLIRAMDDEESGIQLASNEVASPFPIESELPTQMEPDSPPPFAPTTAPIVEEESATPPPASSTPPKPVALDLAQVDRLVASGQDVAALRLLSTWYWQHPGRREEFLTQLQALAGRVYFQPDVHYRSPHTVEFGDRLESIAKEYKIPWQYLANLNRVDPQKIRPGQKLKVIEGPFAAVVDQDQFLLTIHAHGYYVASFPIGIGAEGKTPLGTFHVKDKLADPTYYGPDGTIAHDDPTNPLGEYWIEINDDVGSLSGIGIHGTIDPDSIGTPSSRGCVRLRDADIAAVFQLLSIGSEVVIRR